MFGLGIRSTLFVNLVDPTDLVTAVDGEVEAVVRTQRGERKRLALHHAGLSVDSVPPRELDVSSLGGQAGQGVPADDVRVDQELRRMVKVRLRAAGGAMSLVEAEEASEHDCLRVLVVVLQELDAVDRRQREQRLMQPVLRGKA